MDIDADILSAIQAYAAHRDAVAVREESGHWIPPDTWADLGDDARAIVDILAEELAE